MIEKLNKTILKTVLSLVLLMIVGLAVFFVLYIRLGVEVRDPNLQSPIQFTKAFLELSPTNITNIKEIASWTSNDVNLDVIALSQPISEKKLFVVYKNGKFRSWDINEQKVINEFDFISASNNGVNFSADGSWVITPGRVTSDGLNGYNIWETDTGKRIDCWGAQCPGGDLDDLRYFRKGILLEPNKKMVIEYHTHVVGTTGLQDGLGYGIISIDNPDDPKNPEFERMVMDNSGKYLAYALADGTVVIRETSHFLSLERGTVKGKYFKYANEERTAVIADLEFDDTRKWLALLTNKELMIWDLTAYFSPETKTSIENGNTITFDHNGKIAVVGTNTGIIIINLITRQEIAKYDVGKVTALYFTRDNRLLVWCDENAGIHLWGVSGN